LRPDDQWLSDRADSLGIVFDPALPVSAAWREIARALLANPVLIVCGETGSGKTTQLPKIALAAGRAAKGRSIAHTQPRRLAATSVARRVAQELKSAIGEATSKVGYKSPP
jgi:ATP-dependent helicase HrpA